MWTLRINQAGYAALGLAALALALNRFLSASTSWMRYVTTAAAIQTAVEKFQLDWDKVTAPLAGKTPAGQDLLALINRIEEFSTTVRVLVENETNAWVAEFQANLAELQKSTAAAVETARTQVQAAQQKADADQQAAAQKAVADQQAAQQKAEAAKQAARPGGIDLTIQNAADTDQGYEVLVDGQSKKAGVLSSSCGVLDISPGLHDLEVQATIGGIAAHVSQLVTITAAAATKVQLVLAKQKAKGA
jgi:SMODS and SLOG-associating 2TM effector domain 2